MNRGKYLINATHLAKTIIDNVIKENDLVIDATMGNGNDTLYLANKIGAEGKVYSFDIQQIAIDSTKERLNKENLLERVNLILDGHENMDKYIKEKVSCVIFNLGYLPKGDHSLTTKPNTTISALQKSLHVLKQNGVISIAIYTGHEGGMEEKNAIEEFVKSLDQKQFDVLKCNFINQKNNPPYNIIIEKKIKE